MAYSAVPTKNTGDTWSAADNNTYIRDNMAAMAPDVFTTKGDLFVATGADAGARLAAGTNGYFLTADSAEATGLKYASGLSGGGIGARYTVGATQAVNNASATILQFNTSVFDTDTAVTTGASWKFTVPSGKGGYYMVACKVYFQSYAGWAANEYAKLDLYKGGTINQTLGVNVVTAAATLNWGVGGFGVVSLAQTDYIDVRLYHTAGEAVTVENDANQCHIAIVRLY